MRQSVARLPADPPPTRRLLLGALAVAGLAGCAPRAEEAVLKVGSQKGGTKAMMLASGALEGAPYRVEWSEFAAAQPLLEALGAGAVDLGGVGDAPFLFAYAGGAKIKGVQASRSAGGGASTTLLVRKESAIRTPGDLAGRRIATGRGSVGHYLVLRVLERAGLAPDDVKLTFLTPGDAKAAFSTGAVDAWATWGSYVFLAQRDDGARRLADGRGVMSGYGFLTAGEPAISRKRAFLEDFLRRHARAQRWVAGNVADYARVLARETGLDLEIATSTVEVTRGEPAPTDALVVAELSAVLDRFRSAGVIGPGRDLASAFDISFNPTVAG
ncbi:MAG: ABC transporter substrate-binding protein [Phenylobacterium sp.]